MPSEDGVHPLDQLSSTPCNSTQTPLGWFYNRRQEENRDAMEQHTNDPEWNTACWVLKAATSHIIVEEKVQGPFPLLLMDFHHRNVLLDSILCLWDSFPWDTLLYDTLLQGIEVTTSQASVAGAMLILSD